MNQVIKATRATLEVGEAKINCFQMPDSSYSYGTEFLATLIDRDKTILSNKKSPYYLQTLLGGDKTSLTVKVDGIGYAYKVISQEQVGKVLGALARLGHNSALALLMACAEEALERRADAAFGVKRTEEERNLRLSLIMNSRVTRRSYTDILKDKLIEQYGLEGYKELAKNGYFKDITRRVNLHLFNMPHFKCDRENMTNDQLRDIELFEKQLERRANRFPDQTAEQLFQWMIDQF